MTDIRVHKSGEDLLRQGIGVSQKDGSRVVIKGAVIRIEVLPSKYDYATSEPDYRVSVWIPNATYDTDNKKGGKQFEIDTKKGAAYIGFKDLMAAIVEAATGSKPKNGNEKVEIEVCGFGMEILEREQNATGIIKDSVDPLEEKLPPLPPQKNAKVNVKVTLGGSNLVSAKGHDGSCNCDECTAVRAALRELVSGKSPWLGGDDRMDNNDFTGVA